MGSLYGPGQGSTCGPTFWLIIYWLIVESIDPSITAAQFISVCREVILEIYGTSFVDDTGLGVISTYQRTHDATSTEHILQDIAHTVSQLQVLAQHWEKLLYSTGGAINLQKSF
jgi:hypothetical protein